MRESPRILDPKRSSRRRRMALDVFLVLSILSISIVAVADLVSPLPQPVFMSTLGGLVLVALASTYASMVARPDHRQAVEAQRILAIANDSTAYLRRGLSTETAQAVCRLTLSRTDAAAVAITDGERVLGFVGVGENHHRVGGPITTRATHEVLEHDEHRVLTSAEEIGCPNARCMLQAAVVVPLHVRERPVGTLKFYYTTPRTLNETQVTMAEGLARLLSTQLELAELDRQTQLAYEMELKALQAQINPHFLFNTLNTIAMLIRTDPATARELLREFATFYRRTLEHDQDSITLEREMECVRSYLRFAQARFRDRLDVAIDVTSEAGRVLVPAFLVQPVVENAIEHAFRPDATLHVRVAAALDGDLLRVTVTDDGAGISAEDLERLFEPGHARGLGIALPNVRDRLRGRFGARSSLSVASAPGEGTAVELVADLAGIAQTEGAAVL